MIFTRHPSRILLLALASVGMNAALAQSHTSHDSHDGHGASASPAAITAMDAVDAMDDHASGSPAPMNHGAMDHGSMKMDSGSAAPADARDPHGYSNGYTLDTGPYARKDISALMMSDMHSFGSFLVDRLERVHTRDGNSIAYDTQGWIGDAYDKFYLKAEGDIERGRVGDSRTELLWSHAITPYWDSQLGLRVDVGSNRPGRNWLAFGVQGLAPYWFEVEATGYVGEQGRTALRLAAEYEVLLTQRWVLQPRVEANLYGKEDPDLGIGRGLSSAAYGMRLRYEFSRQLAPYVGIERNQRFGRTASYVRGAVGNAGETRLVAGLRILF
ncbi:copper resistance protein CopB [Herbaspirillum hiltneri N3]|uniref:Copper resistance protein CopB n=2 Tax=Herbaspirillum TaxID=963 RepID=A0ABN4HU15_9BURK|nr:copper resistance protein CopB [Herbaspirillum hiltneri N3]